MAPSSSSPTLTTRAPNSASSILTLSSFRSQQTAPPVARSRSSASLLALSPRSPPSPLPTPSSGRSSSRPPTTPAARSAPSLLSLRSLHKSPPSASTGPSNPLPLPPKPSSTSQPPPTLRVTYSELRPAPRYATDVRRAVGELLAVQQVFADMIHWMSQQPEEIKHYSRIKRLSNLIRTLQQTSHSALSTAQDLAIQYRTFAEHQRLRLKNAPRMAGWRRRRLLDPHQQIGQVGKGISKLSRKLGQFSDALVADLLRLDKELAQLPKLSEEVSGWRAFYASLSSLLKGLADICLTTSGTLEAVGVGEVSVEAALAQEVVRLVGQVFREGAGWAGGKEMEAGVAELQVEKTVGTLATQLPTMVRQAIASPERHAALVEELVHRVDGVKGRCYVTWKDGRRAEREWAREMRILVGVQGSEKGKKGKVEKGPVCGVKQ